MKDDEKPGTISFPLRLPQSLKSAAKVMADRNGLSLNRFISLALTEKIERIKQERLRKQSEE